MVKWFFVIWISSSYPISDFKPFAMYSEAVFATKDQCMTNGSAAMFMLRQAKKLEFVLMCKGLDLDETNI